MLFYILNENSSFALTIFKGDEFLFGAFFKTTTDESLIDEEGEEGTWESAEKEDGISDLVSLDELEPDDELEGLDNSLHGERAFEIE